jgi:RNA 2',3'-cyclic 3'-phosphodiesterase
VRSFIAAWPDEATRTRIGRLLEQLEAPPPARAVQARNLHLTLAFIGELDAARAAEVAQAARKLQPQQFDWSIDQIGWFLRSRVVWIGGPIDEPLTAAAASARAALDELAIGYDHKPFVPHVTVFRDVRAFDRAGPLTESLRWRTCHVALYASTHDRHGPVYRRIDPEG